MARHILIAQSDPASTRLLADFFKERGDRPQTAVSPDDGLLVLEENRPDLVVVDLHMANNGWSQVVTRLARQFPNTPVLFTTHYPDPQLETRLKKQFHTYALLQQPFTRDRLEHALKKLQNGESGRLQADLPRVRVPVRIKITLPYILLALLLALAASYVVSQVILDTIEERFTNQLIEAGKLANDWMVQEEDRLLETLRLVAYTREVPEAVTAGNAERLRELVLPVVVNYQEEAIEILDTQGNSVLSLRHKPGGNIEDYEASRGDTIFRQWDFVSHVLAGQSDQGRDKYAGLARAPWGDYFYVTGPITNEAGQQVGVIMVGKSLPTLVRQIRQDTLAHITIYDLNGRPLATTLLAFEASEQTLTPDVVSTVLTRQDENSLIRSLNVASITYSEIIGPWEARTVLVGLDVSKSDTDLGVIGAALAETFLVHPSQVTRMQVFGLTTVTFLLIIGLGVWVANRITRPLLQVVQASARVAEGNLDVQVQTTGNDEVAVLAHSFNRMVSGLREGSLYRDLLGRTVSPEVREELRRSFASGNIRLEGQDAVATVLMSDIYGFTTLSENVDSTTVMTWLNEYFGELVPIITANGGVISKFEGDAVLAFFGILPRPLSPQESAYRACITALEILQAVKKLNTRRQARGDPPFTTGIGLNTGPVTAGGLGSTDRLHYTIIGDTVNTTARLEGINRQFGRQSSAVISQHTLFALKEKRHEFEFESLGVHNVKGKEEQLLVYRLKPTGKGAVEPQTRPAPSLETSLPADPPQ